MKLTPFSTRQPETHFKRWMTTVLMAASASVLGAVPEVGPSEAYQALWNAPKVSRRIEDGIRANRMGDVALRFTGADGQLLTNVTARIEQTRHEFLFGANIFMLGGFPTPEKNRQFEKTFTSLLNYATVPFYCPISSRSQTSRDSPRTVRRFTVGHRQTRWLSSARSTVWP
jgi:hypothetical protein